MNQFTGVSDTKESEWGIKLPNAPHQWEPNVSTRISVRLEALRHKQHCLLKKLKFMRSARRKFAFHDLELKSDLKDRQPDKERLVYLISEKKRFHEKCFFAEIATKKCQVMTDFYSDCNDRLIDIMDQTPIARTNLEVEKLLQSFLLSITRQLEEARQKLLTQRKGVDKKSKDVSILESEINKAKMGMSNALISLKKKLEKGEVLNDQEILQLSLGGCIDTNSKLSTAVQTNGQQSDELRERFIWKRDEFVSQLAKDHVNVLAKLFAPKLELAVPDERSDPPTPKGSMFDVTLERKDLIGSLARIGRIAEETTKYHYKLKDLKSRVLGVSNSRAIDASSEQSVITVVSNLQSSFDPSSLRPSSLKKIK